jgi:hypothetical protein
VLWAVLWVLPLVRLQCLPLCPEAARIPARCVGWASCIIAGLLLPAFCPAFQLALLPFGLHHNSSSSGSTQTLPILALGGSFDSADQQHPYRNRVAAAEIAEIPSWRVHTSAQLVNTYL